MTVVREVVDVGVWTLGVVLAAGIVSWQHSAQGLEAAAVTAAALVLLTIVLGVTGRTAVASTDDVLSDDVEEGQP